jgi:hypothetical protein
MHFDEATPALSAASADNARGADSSPDRVGGTPGAGDHRVDTQAPPTMTYVRLQGTGMERPFGVYRFSSDARWDLQRWDARARTWFSDPSLARYEGMGGNWYDAEDVSEEEALEIIVELNERAMS